MDYYDEEEIIDESQDQYDDQQEISDEQLSSYGSMVQPKEKSDLYNWFWKVVRLGKIPDKDSVEGFTDESLRQSKVANLNNVEIGQAPAPVRECLNLANLGKMFGHQKFGDYWQSVSMITSATSMAKKGWFMDLSISQKKVRARSRSEASEQQKSKWRAFGKQNKEA